jgi:hypothetical protein
MTDNTAQVHLIRAGDVVRLPTGETVTVAWADHKTGSLQSTGIQVHHSRIAEVELVRAVDDEEHYAQVQEGIRVGGRVFTKVDSLYGANLRAWKARRPKPD